MPNESLSTNRWSTKHFEKFDNYGHHNIYLFISASTFLFMLGIRGVSRLWIRDTGEKSRGIPCQDSDFQEFPDSIALWLPLQGLQPYNFVNGIIPGYVLQMGRKPLLRSPQGTCPMWDVAFLWFLLSGVLALRLRAFLSSSFPRLWFTCRFSLYYATPGGRPSHCKSWQLWRPVYC